MDELYTTVRRCTTGTEIYFAMMSPSALALLKQGPGSHDLTSRITNSTCAFIRPHDVVSDVSTGTTLIGSSESSSGLPAGSS